jgi:hypothetical protein
MITLLKKKSTYDNLKYWFNIVGSVVIGAELGREDHGSIPRNCDGEETEIPGCQN